MSFMSLCLLLFYVTSLYSLSCKNSVWCNVQIDIGCGDVDRFSTKRIVFLIFVLLNLLV